MKRIGLFGGTFNPIHIGHLRAVVEVQEAFLLDEVRIIPSAIPPHKPFTDIADADDRLQMVKLAIGDNSDITVSDVELKRSGLSYTIDTIDFFKDEMPEKTEIFFIMGMDAFLEIDTWKSYDLLFDRVPMITLSRPGIGKGNNHSDLEKIDAFLTTKISDGYRYSPNGKCFTHPSKKPVYSFRMRLLEISASEIRRRIKHRLSIRWLVPEKVEQYIQTRGLFQ